jgi:PTS system cellobiose-specific IIB component
MKILLVCYAGMSTSILMKKISEEAKKTNLELEIEAFPWTELENNFNGADIVLLGPQVKFALEECEKIVGEKIPVMVIESIDYGMMNGKAVLEKVLKRLEQD